MCDRRWRRWSALVLIVVLAAIALPTFPVRSAPNPDIAPGCINLVDNGGFEVIGPQWQIQPSPRPPMYTNEVTFNASQQSMRLGNGVELSDIESVSEVRYLPLQFPRDATRIILRFRYLPRYDADPGEDLQQADLYFYNSNQLALSLLNAQESVLDWRLVEKDLTAYRGQLLSLRFRVRNDGFLGRTWMYLDDVEIEYCSLTPIPPTTTPVQTPIPPTPTPPPPPSPTPPSATPAPTWTTMAPTASPPPPSPWPPSPWPPSAWPPPSPWPTTLAPWPTLEPPPPGCANILANGGFESYRDWISGETPITPRYTNEQVRSGARAILLGNPPGMMPSIESYSSVRQLVTLPRQMTSAQLRWWQLSYSQEPPSPYPNREEDRQEVILLTPNLDVMGVLMRMRTNENTWQQRALDLSSFRGQSFYVYFNVYNDANNARTWMFLDDAELLVCGGVMPYEAGEPQAIQSVLPEEEQASQSPRPLQQELPTETTTTTPAVDTPLPPVSAGQPITSAPVTTTIAAAQPTWTQPGAAVAILVTPTVAPGTALVRVPAPAPVISTPASQPWWRRVLGAIAIMCSIPVLIAIIIVLVIQIRRLRRAPSAPYT